MLVILQLGDFWNIRIVLGELGDVSFRIETSGNAVKLA